ncbi:LemA family protein, partial [Arthrospira platensis SPKY1]|nr:LemA family protein [Arthrospira platensis SPKY1]
EKQVLENVTKARAAVMDAGTTDEKVRANNQLTETLKSLFAVAENYPDLKANENFLALQEELTTTENKIASARQFYNDRVLDFNNLIEVFPNNIVLPAFGKRVKE